MIENFLDMEKKHNLLNNQIDGFQYWAYLRFNIYMKLEEIKNNSNKKKDLSLKAVNKSELYTILKNCIWNNPFITIKQKDILIINHPRRVKKGDYYECIYTEEIANYFNDRAYTLEFLYGLKHVVPVQTPNLLYLDYVDIIPVAKKFFIKRSYKNQIMRIKEEATRIEELITKEFGINLGYNYIYSLLEKRYFWYKIKKKMLKKLLIKINPKVVIETVGYETNKMLINEICFELGIPTIELQHGVMGRGHLAYNYSEKGLYKFFPKKVLIFSEYWREVTNFPLEPKNIVSVGFPYLERSVKEIKKSNFEEDVLSILVISQPEFSNKLITLIFELLKRLNNSKLKYKIIYKLHPAEYEIQNEKLNILDRFENVEIIRDNVNSLYYYFSKSNIQIGVTSTAIFEGLAYDLKTFIYHIEKTDTYMRDLVTMGIAKMFDSAEELLELLISSNIKSQVEYKKNFWEKDAFNKIIKEINNTLLETKK